LIKTVGNTPPLIAIVSHAGRLIPGFAVLLIFSLFLAGCELFNPLPENDLEKKIDDKVAYANAPWVPLSIETSGLGITSPPPQAHDNLVKLGYSFKLVFVPNAGYPFRGWQAWVEEEGIRSYWRNDTDAENAAYYPERVKFVPLNSDGAEVEVFVYEMPPQGKRLVIGPWGATNDELTILPDSGGLGSIYPARLSGVKRDFPFTVNFQPSSAYPFRGWQAKFLSGDSVLAESVWEYADGEEIAEQRSGGVLWSPRNATGLEMNITIENFPAGFSPNAGAIVIGPLGMDSAQLDVQVTGGGLGTAGSTLAVSPARQGYSFTVNFQPSQAYPFRGWQALFYSSGNIVLAESAWEYIEGEENAEQRLNGVLWSPKNATGLEIGITIEEMPEGFLPDGYIIIGPLGMDSGLLNVRVEGGGGLGTAGSTTTAAPARQGYPFTVNFQPSSAYPFRGWQAKFISSGGSVLAAAAWEYIEGKENAAQRVGGILWSPQNASGLEMRVTIETVPEGFLPVEDTIVIGPLGMDNGLLDITVTGGGLGTAGSTTTAAPARQGYPFTISFQPSATYPFRGWQALFYSGDHTILAESSWEYIEGGENVEQRGNGVLWSPKNTAGLEMGVIIETVPAEFLPDGYIKIGPLGMDNGSADNLRIWASSAWGVTNPPIGELNDKRLGFPFTVEFNVASSWAFVDDDGWKAYEDYGAGVLFESKDVKIVAQGGGRAEVTVYTGKAVTLVPYCVERPYVRIHNLPNHFDDRKVTNYPIKIWFSKEIDPVCYNAGNWTLNFIITAKGNYGSYNQRDITSYYDPPVAEGELITIARKKDAPKDFYNLNITIQLNLGGIKDKDGISMGESGQYREFYYGVSATTYDKPPQTINLEAVGADGMFNTFSDDTTSDDTTPEANKNNYVKNELRNGKREVYLLFDKDEAVDFTYTQISGVKVTEVKNGVVHKLEKTGDVKISTAGAIYEELADLYRVKHRKEPYIVLYELETDEDGEIQLAVQPVDELGNYKNYYDANKISVIIDTTPPAPVTNADITVSGSDTDLKLEWTNPDDPGFDNVLISWGKAGETQNNEPPIQGQSNTPSDITFHNITEDKFYTFNFKTVDVMGNESESKTVAVYNRKKAYIVANPVDWGSAVAEINDEGNDVDNAILVTGSFSIPGRTENTFDRSGINVVIGGDSSVRTISLSSNGILLGIFSGQTVTLTNLTFQGHSSNNNTLVWVNSGGKLVMNPGSAIKNNANTSLGNDGGGVYINGGTFEMNDGTISGNSAALSSGGVHIQQGTFIMNNGIISDNIAGDNGGGVLVLSDGTFIMYGGTISRNTARNSTGGGVSVLGGTFEMNDGTISGNTVIGSGGGVFVENGIFSKTCGTIYGYNSNDTVNSNTAKNSSGTVQGGRGHAVYALRGSIVKRRETTIGTGVNLTFNGTTNSLTWIGLWDYEWVPGGSFQMGKNGNGSSENVTPVHTVTVDGFYMSKYQITQLQYQAQTGTNPSHTYGVGDNYPVYYVTWYDAVEFCNKLSTAEGLDTVYTISGRSPATGYPITSATVSVDWSKNGYRLPTEAEWEYAAKGGNGSPGNYIYSGSNTIGDIAWYTGNSGIVSHVVGTKAPNGLGIYDMSGNVRELCWDWLGAYSNDPQENPKGPSTGIVRVTRGGSFFSTEGDCRSVHRGPDESSPLTPSDKFPDIGFRLVRKEED